MMAVAAIAASILLALVSAASGVPKVLGTAAMVKEAHHLGLTAQWYLAIGALELVAAVGLLTGLAYPGLGTIAASGLALLMVGAVASHVRAGDPLSSAIPALVVGFASVATAVLLLARLS